MEKISKWVDKTKITWRTEFDNKPKVPEKKLIFKRKAKYPKGK